MTKNSHQPRASDVVLGSQASAPVNALVLGGLAGVKRRLMSPVVTQRVAALKETLNYGQEGLDLVIQSLQDESWQVRQTAYLLLQDSGEPTLKQVLASNPYQLFQCLYRHATAQSTAYCVAISPDGQLLVSAGSDRKIKVRSLQTGKILRTLSGHSGSIYAIAISPDGQRLVSGGWDNTIKVWDLHAALTQSRSLGDGLLHTLVGYSGEVNSVAISPDGLYIASGSEDGTIKLWDLHTGQLIDTLIGHAEAVKSVAISPDSQIVSGGADNTIKRWQPLTSTSKAMQNGGTNASPLQTLTGHANWVKSLSVSHNGQILASASQDKTIKLWNLSTGEELHTLTGHWGEVNAVVMSPDGHTLLSCSWDETIRMWHLPTGVLLHTLEGHQGAIAGVAISPDGQKIISSSWDQTIRVWGVQ